MGGVIWNQLPTFVRVSINIPQFKRNMKTYLISIRELPRLVSDYLLATRPLSRCYLRSYLVTNTAGAYKEPSKKYKNNIQTLKSKDYEQCRTKQEYYNNKAPHFLTAGLQIFPI